jgi:hypothetical protein
MTFKPLFSFVLLFFTVELYASAGLEAKHAAEKIDHFKMDQELENAYKKADQTTRKTMIRCLEHYGCAKRIDLFDMPRLFRHSYYQDTYYQLNFVGLSKGIMHHANNCKKPKYGVAWSFNPYNNSESILDAIASFGNDQLTRYVYTCYWQQFNTDPVFLLHVLHKPYCHLDPQAKKKLIEEKRLFGHEQATAESLAHFAHLGVDLDAPNNENGDTQLMRCACRGTPIEWLVQLMSKRNDSDACINHQNEQGDTALIIAARQCTYDAAIRRLTAPYVLLCAGADPFIQDKQGMSFIRMQTTLPHLHDIWVKFKNEAHSKMLAANTASLPAVILRSVGDYLYFEQDDLGTR